MERLKGKIAIITGASQGSPKLSIQKSTFGLVKI